MEAAAPTADGVARALGECEGLVRECLRERGRRERQVLDNQALRPRELRLGRAEQHQVQVGAYVFFSLRVREARGFWLRVVPLDGARCAVYLGSDLPTRTNHTWRAAPDAAPRTVRVSDLDVSFAVGVHEVGVLGVRATKAETAGFLVSWGYEAEIVEDRCRAPLRRLGEWQSTLSLETRKRVKDMQEDIALRKAVLRQATRRPRSKQQRMLLLLGWPRERKRALGIELRVVLALCARGSLFSALAADAHHGDGLRRLRGTLQGAARFEREQQRRAGAHRCREEEEEEEEEEEPHPVLTRKAPGQTCAPGTLSLRDSSPMRFLGPRTIKVGSPRGGYFQQPVFGLSGLASTTRPRPQSASSRARPQSACARARRQSASARARPKSATSKARPQSTSSRTRPQSASSRANTSKVPEAEEAAAPQTDEVVRQQYERVLDCSQSRAHLSLGPVSVGANSALAAGAVCFARGVDAAQLVLFLPVVDGGGKNGGGLHGCELWLVRHTHLSTIHAEWRIDYPLGRRTLCLRTIDLVPSEEWVDIMVQVVSLAQGKVSIWLNGKPCTLAPFNRARRGAARDEPAGDEPAGDEPRAEPSSGQRREDRPRQSVYLSRVALWRGLHVEGQGLLFRELARYDLDQSCHMTKFGDALGNHGEAFGIDGARMVVRTEHLGERAKVQAIDAHLDALFARAASSATLAAEEVARGASATQRAAALEECEALAVSGQLNAAVRACQDALTNLASAAGGADAVKDGLCAALQLKKRLDTALRWSKDKALSTLGDGLPVLELADLVWASSDVAQGAYAYFVFPVREMRDVLVEIHVLDGDPDLYVHALPPFAEASALDSGAFPTTDHFTWASAGDGGDEVLVRANDQDFRLGRMLVSVHGATKASFEIRFYTTAQQAAAHGAAEGGDGAEDTSALQDGLEAASSNRDKFWFAKLGSRFAA